MSREPACRSVPPELFFPLGYGREFARQIEEAKAVCRACPVYSRCRDYVLANPELAPEGIWAATTPKERRRLREQVALDEAAARLRERAEWEAAQAEAIRQGAQELPCRECGRVVGFWPGEGVLASHSAVEGQPPTVEPCPGGRRQPRLAVVSS
ncbi:WhiB family transcriptional regulator [Microbispora sp. GKU 823]|uniref:WhiB family transcriptional regulator n=1 Tax=Microbispora sp. GKU 823 TaxID=1652100 RepID=UPI002117E0CC|nr:WhiB family transcriptional regulator [Microbispora sp. GKU 823]